MQREGLTRSLARNFAMKTRVARSSLALAAACATLIAASGAAFARPDTRSMTCAQAQALVGRNGAVVLTTGQYTYDRFVADGRYCDIPYIPKLTWVRTRDDRQCAVGYTCQQNSDEPSAMFIR